jgi:hypothetical protein
MKLEIYNYSNTSISYHYFKNSVHYQVLIQNKKISHTYFCNYIIIHVK